MAIDIEGQRSRRAVLAAALGGVAASVAAALGRPTEARAADFENVVLSQENHATVETGVINDHGGETAFYGHVGGSGTGLLGESSGGAGVKGTSVNGIGVNGMSSHIGVRASGVTNGVFATATTGIGVEASSASGMGVWGNSVSNTGVLGETGSSTGVFGYSGSHVAQPAAPPKTGVYGYAAQDADARGVHGQTTAGRGVYGQATNGQGVRGQATSGAGVYAIATTGYALRTSGRVRFDKSGGVATVLAGTNSILVNPGIALETTTAVVATLQGTAGGTTTVHRVAIDAAANTFRIYLTANAASNVKVAWFVFG